MEYNEIINLVNDTEQELAPEFTEINNTCMFYSEKVLKAFQNNHLNEACFAETTGYGYNDIGREKIEKIFAELFGAEDAIVRNQFVSGSHALAKTLFALLRPNDLLLSISGLPYDTLHEVIGIVDNPSSLKAFGIKYDQIDLVNNDFAYDKIKEYITNNPVKVIEIQRSKGYSTRESLTMDKISKVISFIKDINSDIIIMIDNCYCEMVERTNPIEAGADVVVGSLIKNLGGGISPNGAYVVGKTKYIDLIGEALTLPGEGREVGPTLGINKKILSGLFFAPSVIASSLKTAVLTAKVMEKLGYQSFPKYNEPRADIVENIIFNNPDDLIKYVQGIQAGSPIDSDAIPMPWDMPGYKDQVIMAAGCFTQGSSIELSCDGPIRSPYVAYQQGGLTYEYGKLGLISAINYLKNK